MFYFYEKVDMKYIHLTNIARFHNYSYMVQSYGNDGKMFDPNIKFDYNLFFAINRYLKFHVNEWLGGTFNQTFKLS